MTILGFLVIYFPKFLILLCEAFQEAGLHEAQYWNKVIIIGI